MAKIFRGKEINFLFSQMKVFFHDVYCAKPKSSRNSSQEAFIIGRKFKHSEGNPLCSGCLLGGVVEEKKATETEQKSELHSIVEYVRCGDISGLDKEIAGSTVAPTILKDPMINPASFKDYLSLFNP